MILHTCHLYFSTYRTTSGDTVPILNRTYRAGWDAAEAVRLAEAFDCSDSYDVTTLLEQVLTDTSYAVYHDLQRCETCSDWSNDCQSVGGDPYCPSCLEDFAYCESCCEYAHADDMRSTYGGSGNDVCEDCRERNYTYCDACDYYVSDGDDDHYHEPEQCYCEAREQTFTLAGLGNDDERSITLPAGTIDDEGMCSIRSYLYAEGYPTAASLAASLDPAWIVTKGGTFLKRLSSALYKHDGSKLPADVVSHVGNIAARHSTGADFRVAVTRDVNVPAYEMGNEGSCWYAENNGGHEDSLCYLKSSGGMALRSFDDHGNVSGRSWVVPLDSELCATVDAEGATAFVIFNHYGDLEGYAGARILAQVTGMSYRTLSGGFTLGDAYINPGSAILVAPADVLAEAPTAIRLSVSEHVRESVSA